MKNVNEKLILDKFKAIYAGFPKGEIQKSEKPDFLVQSGDKRVGIEITEVFQDSHKGQSNYQQLSSDRHEFTKQLIQELQKFVDFTFHISIHFSYFNHLRKSERNNVLKSGFRICINSLIHLENLQTVLIEDFKKLPKEIDSIQIGRFDGLDESYDEQPEGGVVSEMTDMHIRPILEKKNQKLKHYQECEEQWLLIREGNYYAGSFSDIKITTPIESDFNKIFLFRMSKSEIIHLK